MQAALLDASATLYARPTTDAPVVRRITQGAELDLDPPTQSAPGWYTVHLPEGHTAYLEAATSLRPYRLITLAADTDVYAEPRRDAPIVYRYGKHAVLVDTSGQGDEHSWTRVQDGQGEVGFLPPGTRFLETEVLTPQQRSDAERVKKAKDRMLTGGLLFAGGAAVTFFTHHAAVAAAHQAAAASASSYHYTYILAWGPMLFGGIRFALGFGGWFIYSGKDTQEDEEALA